MTASLPDTETYETTYRRDFAVRTLEMTGSLPRAAPVKSAGVGPDLRKRPRRRARRATETSSLSPSGGRFVLPGRSLTVGPAPGTQRAADERDHHVSEALRFDLPDGAGVDYSQWLLSKLPEIVEKCCRQQEPPPRVIEVLPPPVRRKIHINVKSNPQRASPERRQDDRSDEQRGDSAEEFVLDGAGLRQVHRPRSPLRARRRRRSARGAASSSACSLESARRSAEGDAATAELVRRVLEEMFGHRPAAGGGTYSQPAQGHRRSSSRSCQTSPRLGAGLSDSRERAGREGDGVTEMAAQTDSSGPSPRQPPLPPPVAVRSRSPLPPPVAVGSRPPSPRPRDTSRCILDTLTESNRLLRQMSEFFRRAELNDRITQRAELGDQLSPRAGLLSELPIKRAEREGRITQRPRAGRLGDGWRWLNAPAANGSGGGGGGGTARSDGGCCRGDGPPPDALRHCSDSELSARIRRYSAAAEQGLTVRSWEERQQPATSPAPASTDRSGWEERQQPATSPAPASTDRSGWEERQQPATSPAPASTDRSGWGSPQLLELHSEERPYRPLVSPPLGQASDESHQAPRTSSPVETARLAGQPCSLRQTVADVDSTDVLLDYDPWHAIENDFKTLLN